MFTVDQQNDFDALVPAKEKFGTATRRNALKVALGVGYAAASLPVLAQTAIKTSAEGLTTGVATYDVNGFKVPFFFAAPAHKTQLPVILLVQEIFGVHEYITDVARRLAHAGYLAIAPELFARQGNPRQYSDTAILIAELVSKVPDAQVMADLDGAVQWAVQQQGANSNKVGITGFCWGGRITWLYAAQRKNIKAGVAWYGRLVGTPTALTPQHPLDIAATMEAPVLGLYGGQDSGIGLDTVKEMQDALAAAKGNPAAQASELVVYPDAPHAFHADYRPSYRQEAAADGFARALAWFKKYGVV